MLSIIVCSYKRPDLIECVLTDISACAKVSSKGWELIVVDNAGDEQTKSICDKFKEQGLSLTYIFEPSAGLSAARNRGVDQSRGDWLLFIDDDVRFGSDYLSQMTETIEACDADIVCSRIVTPIKAEWPNWLKVRLKSGVGQYDLGPEPKRLDHTTKPPVGASICFRRRLYDCYGPFNEALGRNAGQLFGGEETQLLRRAFVDGAKGIYLPNIEIQHEFVAGKESQAYWRRQGFYGGRSTLRLVASDSQPSLTRMQMAGFALRSFIKSMARFLIMLASRDEFFENQYRAIAHFGVCYEALMMLGRPFQSQ